LLGYDAAMSVSRCTIPLAARHLRYALIIGAITIAVSGCAWTNSLDMKPHATINDVDVKPRDDSGYELVAIDDKPVERKQSRLKKTPPYALVEPGVHKLTLSPKSTANPQPKPTTISAVIEAGGKYRIKVSKEDESVYVVDDAD
jgi:hypothetical protein